MIIKWLRKLTREMKSFFKAKAPKLFMRVVLEASKQAKLLC